MELKLMLRNANGCWETHTICKGGHLVLKIAHYVLGYANVCWGTQIGAWECRFCVEERKVELTNANPCWGTQTDAGKRKCFVTQGLLVL